MKRVVIPELLDSDAGTPAEIQSSLADLRRVNRWFGGNSTTFRLLQRVAQQSKAKHLSMLEVAAGSGDVPQAAKAAFEREHGRVAIHIELTTAGMEPKQANADAVWDLLLRDLEDAGVVPVSRAGDDQFFATQCFDGLRKTWFIPGVDRRACKDFQVRSGCEQFGNGWSPHAIGSGCRHNGRYT